MLTAKEPVTSNGGVCPKNNAGWIDEEKIRAVDVERIVPSIEEALPPVTRARMFWILAGPENVATSPALRLNCEKLWKRLFPTVRPMPAVML